MKRINNELLKEAYLFACAVDVNAFKPGNVSIYAAGHDMTVADFQTSAKVSVAPLICTNYTLGEKIYYAVKATREAVGQNTNLGIILLCAPIVYAIQQTECQSIRSAIASVLEHTTVQDADWVYRAIALASPGGLGEVAEEDVHESAAITLTQAMELAADRDRVALQYKKKYKDIFESGILRYNAAFNQWGDHNWAAAAVYTSLLRQYPDSHIERKYGNQYTRMVSARMALLDLELSKTNRPGQLEALFYSVDNEFKSLGVNPGTTADLTVTTAMAAYLEILIESK